MGYACKLSGESKLKISASVPGTAVTSGAGYAYRSATYPDLKVALGLYRFDNGWMSSWSLYHYEVVANTNTVNFTFYADTRLNGNREIYSTQAIGY